VYSASNTQDTSTGLRVPATPTLQHNSAFYRHWNVSECSERRTAPPPHPQSVATHQQDYGVLMSMGVLTKTASGRLLSWDSRYSFLSEGVRVTMLWGVKVQHSVLHAHESYLS
jgi:hypothetical protein